MYTVYRYKHRNLEVKIGELLRDLFIYPIKHMRWEYCFPNITPQRSPGLGLDFGTSWVHIFQLGGGYFIT